MLESQQRVARLTAYVQRRDDHVKVINFSKSIRDRERRRSYLLSKAQCFLGRQEYDQAAMICWHILYQVDAQSHQAAQMLNTAYSRIFGPRRPR